ncbi:MAG: hypothetical protein ACPLW9_01460 [Minisyncoccales bacterium]
MINILTKIKFFLTKPSIVVIIGSEQNLVANIIIHLLKQHFHLGKDIFVFKTKEINKFSFYFKNSPQPILVLTSFESKFSVKNLPSYSWFVLNYEDEKLRENIDKFENFKIIKFGLSQESHLFVSDIKVNSQTNFKVNYQGSTVPFWLNDRLSEIQIRDILAAVGVGLILGLNLVEISQSFNYFSLKKFT